MSARPPIVVAIIAALLASGFALRADGAIIAMSGSIGIAAGPASGRNADTSKRKESREELSEMERVLPADSTSGMSSVPSSLSGGAGPIAAIDAQSVVLSSDEPTARLVCERKIGLADAHPMGLLRPPTCF